MIFNPYLNFDGQAEEAFNFYKSVFGGEFSMVQRMGDMPGSEQIPENEKNRLMHIALPINDQTVLMASDCMTSAGHVLNVGNNMYISIHTESRDEADRLFNGLSAGGFIEMPMEDMFWGDYFGSFKDKYGIQWMINFSSRAKE
jgi:PhnB protein